MKKILAAFTLLATLGTATQTKGNIPPTNAVQLLKAVDAAADNETVTMHVSEELAVKLNWQERISSFSRKEGIRVFLGYSGSVVKGALSVRGNRVSGWIFDKDVTYNIETGPDGNLVYTLQADSEERPHRCCTKEGAAAQAVTRPEFRTAYAAAVEGGPQWSEQIGEPLVYNDGMLYVYRLALPVAYKIYTNNFGGDVQRVKEYWATSLALLNDLYVREIGVFFELVDDDRLIVTDPDYEWPSSTNSYTIMTEGTFATNKLIGAENYDVACGAATCSDGQGGLTSMVAAYYKNWKGNCFIAYGYNGISIIGHELGHTIGGLHTYTTGGIVAGSTSHTEPGNGQSIMSYGSPMDFFALYNVHQIRRCQSYLPYLNYPARTDTFELEKLRDVNYTNFVAAIPTDNRPPVINSSKLKKLYRIPRDTYFQFHIEATDPDGDELNYMAHQTDIDRKGEGVATYICRRLQSDPTIKFQPTFEYSWFNRKYSVTKYTEIDPSVTGTFHFWLAATDGKTITDWDEFLKHPHAMGYDMYETQLEVLDGTPFKITSVIPNKNTCGERLRLTWDVDKNIFDEDSRVRILLSDDFGKTFKYVLKESAPNNGSCEVIFPHIPINGTTVSDDSYETIRAGVIKIEEVGGVAYALSAIYPYEEYNGEQIMTGGFMLWETAIKFGNTPERYITVESDDDIPEVADVTATYNGEQLEVTFTETRDGNVVTRVWEAQTSIGTRSAYEQIICINTPGTSVSAGGGIENSRPGVNVYVNSGQVYVKGAAGMTIQVYDTKGQMVFSKKHSANTECVSLRPGIYIIYVDGVSYKLIV